MPQRSLFEAQTAGCHSALHLVQVVASQPSSPPIWFITRGAQSVRPTDPVSIAQSPLLGFGRTTIAEFPRIPCRLVDLGPGKPETGARNLIRELQSSDHETEVAWRDGARFCESHFAHAP